MSRTPTGQLSPRHLAMLRAVGAGRAELTTSCEPDLYVDGLCCCDHQATSDLVKTGLIEATVPAGIGQRVAARLTDAGRAKLGAGPALVEVA